MDYIKHIIEFIPSNEQESQDKKVILDYIEKFPYNILLRENEFAHITSSGFIMNKSLDKVLMIHHNIRNTWAWTGGHVDGDDDFLYVAIKEAKEETGINEVIALTENIVSIDILPVFGHIKRNQYVSTHLHLSIAYILIASEDQKLIVKDDENSDVKWMSLDRFNENYFDDKDVYLYNKLINRAKKIMMKSNYEAIINKIIEMNITSTKGDFIKYSEEEITSIENEYGFIFPEEYRLFLQEYGNSYFNKDGVYYSPIEKHPWTAEDGFASIGGFYGLGKWHENIVDNIECYSGRMSKSLIPIADDGCGNQICIGVCDDYFGKIYFWDHENEMESKVMLGYIDKSTAEIDKYNLNLYLIAESFKDFIDSFTIREEPKSKIDLDTVEVWLSDDL